MEILDISALNGNYSIIYQADAPETPFVWFDHTNATAELLNGVLIGRDAGGASWAANFEFEREGVLKFVAKVSTEQAPMGTFLLDKSGNPTKAAQDYSGTLKVIEVDNHIVITGIVVHGVVKTSVQLKRV